MFFFPFTSLDKDSMLFGFNLYIFHILKLENALNDSLKLNFIDTPQAGLNTAKIATADQGEGVFQLREIFVIFKNKLDSGNQKCHRGAEQDNGCQQIDIEAFESSLIFVFFFQKSKVSLYFHEFFFCYHYSYRPVNE